MAEPIFCKICGKRLVTNDTISGYDEFTGDPIRPFLHTKRCPNWDELTHNSRVIKLQYDLFRDTEDAFSKFDWILKEFK